MEINYYTKTCDLELAEQIARKADRINKRAERNGLTGQVAIIVRSQLGKDHIFLPVVHAFDRLYQFRLVTHVTS